VSFKNIINGNCAEARVRGRERKKGREGFKGEKREFIVGEKGLKSSLIIINKGLNILKFLLL
jgi:hypothetical protein